MNNAGGKPSHADTAGLPVDGAFRIPVTPRNPVPRALTAAGAGALEYLLGLRRIEQLYIKTVTDPKPGDFMDQLLAVLDVSYEVSESDPSRIPRTGAVVVVANQGFGSLEGILLMSLLRSVRPDVKVMANYWLARIPQIKDDCIFVNPFDQGTTSRMNFMAMKEALKWLKAGGMLLVFPSGEVAHYELRARAVVESRWSSAIAGLIRHTAAPVLPAFLEGTNSWLFHAAGLVHPRLRTVLLPRELLNKQHRKFRIHIGNAIDFRKLEKKADMMAYLRMRTYNLGQRQAKAPQVLRFPFPFRKPPSQFEPIIPPVPVADMEAEMISLGPQQRLVQSGDLEVWVGRAHQIPRILREIGRLRELTFRAVGEGTGHAMDLDKYDQYYLHLFVWNRPEAEIVAAYRLGPTDEILPVSGQKGLYTSTLFKYRDPLLAQITPALEMGRTFVREAYQRNFNSLYMLWKGIACFVMREPRYKVLFGPVSINANYQSTSRDLMVSFLTENNFDTDLARMVKARVPLKAPGLRRWKSMDYLVDDLHDVESLIADVETELQGIPILLKQYLRLGGKLLGFNVDPDFSYVLDGLILVDLTETDCKVLQHYMGADGIRQFLAFHGFVPGQPKPVRAAAAPTAGSA